MFTEEVGVSPVVGDGGALYRARVSELVQSGRSFARIEEGRVIFKAEVGAVTSPLHLHRKPENATLEHARRLHV